MKRSLLNLLVDILSLLVFVALTSTGLILEWKLPPGSGRVGGPEGPDHPMTLLWGWDRHEWGELHFFLGILFLAVLSIHVGLHWRWIKSMFSRRRQPADPRAIVGVVGLTLLLIALMVPLAGRPRSLTRGEVRAQRGLSQEPGVRNPSTVQEMSGQAIYREACLRCHLQPQKLPPLDLSWSQERLRETPPSKGHQELKAEDLTRVFEYVRAAQLTTSPVEP